MTEDPAFVWNRPASPPAPSRAAVDPDRSEQPTDPPPPMPAATDDPPPAAPADRPEERDSVLVPLDQWSRILNQLGNLHEAGQQLAEARERAAKAETESAFLRERLKEMRTRVESMEEAATAPPPEPEPEPSFGVWFLRRQLQRRRSR